MGFVGRIHSLKTDAPPGARQSFMHRNASQPGYKFCPPFETRQILVSTDVGILHHVLGLRIVAQRMVRLTTAQAEAFYGVHRERKFFPDLVKFMTEGPLVGGLCGSGSAAFLWLLARAKEIAGYPVMTKSGIIVGLGETNEEVVETLRDLRAHGVDVVTIGQYLQPSPQHAKIDRWVHPDEFRFLREQGEALGFGSVFSGPLVRSSYRADEQRHAAAATARS